MWQRRFKDCGPSCLDMVARYHGRSVGLSEIRRLCGWRWSGSHLLGLSKAAQQMGFTTVCAQVRDRVLNRVPLPCIAHVRGDHFLIVRDVDSQYVQLSDPIRGNLQMTREQFLSQWEGIVLLLWPAASR